MNHLRPDALTWTGLLTQWMKFAQASLAIPDNHDGPRWRSSVPAVINLQAVTFALADLEQLDPAERALAMDKAELLIDQNVNALHTIWNDGEISHSLREICDDARTALLAVAGGEHES
jgi:hypothetical protein